MPTINRGSANHCDSEEECHRLVEVAGEILVIVDCCREMAPVLSNWRPNIRMSSTFSFLRHGKKLGTVTGANKGRLRQGLDNGEDVPSVCSKMPCVVQ